MRLLEWPRTGERKPRPLVLASPVAESVLPKAAYSGLTQDS
jgi:hypothetical protein